MVPSSSDQPLTGIDPTKLPPLQELLGRNYVSIEQLANLCGVTYRTARTWIQQKKINGVKVGGFYRIYEDELRRFLEMGNMPTTNIDRNIEGAD